MRFAAPIIAVALGIVAGCASPVVGVPRLSQPLVDRSKTVRVLRDIGWYSVPPTRGVTLPPGIYVLEAEDADYWFLRCPVAIEVLDLVGRNIVSKRRLPGGIMIAKRFNPVPAAAYVDSAPAGRLMVLEFGNDFSSLEGKYWRKNF